MLNGLTSLRNRSRFSDLGSDAEPSRLDQLRSEGQSITSSVSKLTEQIKADLRRRMVGGERPTINDYLERFPELRAHGDRVLSLIYEEFCLAAECGGEPDPEEFCERYAPWRDSLASQLRYHRLLSRAAGTPTPLPCFPEPGDYFQEFRLKSLLGQGGAAQVFLARDESLGGREVALKISVDRGQEASILGRLDHSHIVRVLSVAFEPKSGLRALCMPYRAGLPLDAVIRRVGPATSPRGARALLETIAPPEPGGVESLVVRPGWASFPMGGTYADGVAWIAATLARALGYAHEQAILHRDVKPANVLLTHQDGPQLLDFNLAHDPNTPDQAGAALRGGTLPYMAPEQLEAFLDPTRWDQVGAAADLYSLGLVMHELLTGQAPGAPEPLLPLPRAIRALLDLRVDFLPSSRRFNLDVPHALDGIIARCLAFSPARRYPDALALADDLQRFLDRRPLRYATNPSRVETLGNRLRRNRASLVLVAGSLVVASVLLYAPIVRLVVPVERREIFVNALDDLDRGDSRKAITALEDLARSDPKSPLAQLALSLALAMGGRADEAAKQYSLMLSLPDAETIVTTWGVHEKRAAGWFESLGQTLLRIQQDRQASRAFQTALTLDPSLKTARQELATADEIQYHFRSAWAGLTRLIESARKEASRPNPEQLIAWYQSRARVSIRWAQNPEGLDSNAADDAARSLFNQALDDLKQGESLIHPADNRRKNQFRFLTAEARAGLGDIAARLHQQAASVQEYRYAKAIVDRLVPSDSIGEPALHALSQRLVECLNSVKEPEKVGTSQDGSKVPSY